MSHINSDLSNNTIKSIPEELFTLTNLTVLDLSNNAIDDLPNMFDSLYGLQELIVSGNNLLRLPPSVINHQTLETL